MYFGIGFLLYLKVSMLAFWIIVSQLAGVIGSIFTTSSIASWYQYLVKPGFNPPNWLFGPVWVSLYTLMGVASWLVWKRNKRMGVELKVFLIHLLFNSLWLILFFGLQRPGWAFLEILLLWLMILYLTIKFYSLVKWAGWLMVPYFLWVSFASFLNYYIWQLNR